LIDVVGEIDAEPRCLPISSMEGRSGEKSGSGGRKRKDGESGKGSTGGPAFGPSSTIRMNFLRNEKIPPVDV